MMIMDIDATADRRVLWADGYIYLWVLSGAVNWWISGIQAILARSSKNDRITAKVASC